VSLLLATPALVALARRVLYCWWGHDLIRDRLASGAPALVCRHCLTAYPIHLELQPCRTSPPRSH
jgi:hypothetical protein